jgi:superfamily I DNA/RNA helicase
MPHTPTPEQQAIIDAAKGTTDNICVNALAGAAKTTTLEMLCQAITGIPILSLAFNKRIADEMAKRLPSHVEVRTLNALGHRVWASAISRKLVLDANKSHKLLRMAIDELPRNRREEAYEDIADTLKWLRLAKRDGWIPKKWRGLGTALATDSWLTLQDEDMTDLQFELFETVMNQSINNAYAGEIDFDDQLYMPVCFGGQWPKFPLVLCDEVQDLSLINHVMLEKLFYKRMIIVGDPWQSIYGFRGSVQNGMQALVAKHNMREMTLSTTFRVPKLGVERAWFRVPHMRAPDWQIDGTIKVLPEWSADDVPDSAAIICRNNAPLFTAALRLLRAGRGIKLVGMDIGAGLVRIMKKLGPPNLAKTDLAGALDRWLQGELNKNKSANVAYEKFECLHVLCFHPAASNLGQAIAFAEDLFKRSGPIQLLSGHKAKGLEFETVIHLDPWRIPSKFVSEGTEEYEQELNVRYVIETRFKKELYLANMEDFT